MPPLHWLRRVDLTTVAAVGFDLDFTLAPYDLHEVTRATLEIGRADLEVLGGPAGFDPLAAHDRGLDERLVRGMILDVDEGLVLQTDAFGVVHAAFDLEQDLNEDEISARYGDHGPVSPNSRFSSLDAFYSLADFHAFLGLSRTVHDAEGRRLLWAQVRAVNDRTHGAGAVYQAIVDDIGRFVPQPPPLAELMDDLRGLGLSPFIVSNAPVAWARQILEALVEGSDPLFDVAVLRADKPRFFASQRPLQRLRPTGFPLARESYVEGSLRALEEHLDLRGRSILYVGDHIYSDIVRASNRRGWRTVLIVPELDTPGSEVFRVPNGDVSFFGWQVLRFAFAYTSAVTALSVLPREAVVPGLEVRLPHEAVAPTGLGMPQPS